MCYTRGTKTLNRPVSRRAFVTGGLFAASEDRAEIPNP